MITDRSLEHRLAELERRLDDQRSEKQRILTGFFNAENSVIEIDDSQSSFTVAEVTITVPDSWDGTGWIYDARLWFTCTYFRQAGGEVSFDFRTVTPAGVGDVIRVSGADRLPFALVDLASGLTAVGAQSFAVEAIETDSGQLWHVNDRRLLVDLTARLPDN